VKNIKWICITLLGAALMVIGSAVGTTAFYEFLYNIFSDYINPDLKPIILNVLSIISFLAAGGGYTVIVGLILVILNQYRLGRIIISFGTGFGIIGIIVYISYYIINFTGIITDSTILSHIEQIYGLFTFNSGFGFVGTILVIIGKFGLKKPEEEEKELLQSKEEATEVFDTQVKYCPNCGTALPVHANFCNECGTEFGER
jgi:hypothetical protein